MSRGTDDTSSSEDEISKEALREAADRDLLKDAYFSGKNDNQQQVNKTSLFIEKNTDKITLKSLRRIKGDDQFENLGVSPSFQNFVAKKLGEIIDRTVKLKDGNGNVSNEGIKEKASENASGIKLLHSSTKFLTAVEETEIPIVRKRSKKVNTPNEKDNLSRCKEVAVNPEWILSQKGTIAWTNKRNGPEFKYKRLKNGVLVEET